MLNSHTNFWHDCFEKIDVSILLQIVSKVFEADFISLLPLGVVGCRNLDGIIRQVDVSISQIGGIVRKARCSYISLFVKVAPEMNAVDDLGKRKHSYVEFTHRRVVPVLATNKQRFLNVLLHDPLFTNPCGG